MDNSPNISATLRDILTQYVEDPLTNSQATKNRLDNLKATKLALDIWLNLKQLGIDLDIAGQIISGERRVPVPELTNANPNLQPPTRRLGSQRRGSKAEFIEKRQVLYDFIKRAKDPKDVSPFMLTFLADSRQSGWRKSNVRQGRAPAPQKEPHKAIQPSGNGGGAGGLFIMSQATLGEAPLDQTGIGITPMSVIEWIERKASIKFTLDGAAQPHHPRMKRYISRRKTF